MQNARIITFGYDAHTFGKSAADLRDHARSLIDALDGMRKSTEVRFLGFDGMQAIHTEFSRSDSRSPYHILSS